MSSPIVGILAVQGAFIEHARVLEKLGCEVVELRQRSDLRKPIERLVLPGGESTTQAKLLRDLGMLDGLRDQIESGMPVLGTCAGLILLASRVESASDGRLAGSRDAADVKGFRTMPVTVRRNGYGRQMGSFNARAPLLADGDEKPFPLVFIRAPRIIGSSNGVEPLIALEGEPVAVRFRNQIGCAFHPELTEDVRIHKLFLEL